MSPPSHGMRCDAQSWSDAREARSSRSVAALPHSTASCLVEICLRRSTANALKPSTSSVPPELAWYSSSSGATSSPTSAAAAISWAWRCASTSWLSQPGTRLGSSQAGGGVYCTVRPKPSRSKDAAAMKSVRDMGIGAGLYPRPVRVLIAPDKFRGTLSAEQAALAIEIGWLRGRPDDAVARAPMADGGEGTLDALLAASNGLRIMTRVTG